MSELSLLFDLLDRVQKLEDDILAALEAKRVCADAVPMVEDSMVDVDAQRKRSQRDAKRRDQINVAKKRISSWQASMGT